MINQAPVPVSRSLTERHLQQRHRKVFEHEQTRHSQDISLLKLGHHPPEGGGRMSL